MARKLFDTIRAGAPAIPPAPSAADPADDAPRIRSARALRGGLLEMSANAVRDIDPAAIIADGPRDRLALDDDGIRALADSIRAHGQQVPVLVRPAAEPDRYRIVYGRRRLAAARLLGVPVKALVRGLDDTASVLAQGQENSLRLNPSFIEKAVFVAALRDAGYDSGTVQEALGISRQALSVLTIVQQSIPLPVIEAIGPAHDIGRRRWMELADLAREGGVDLSAVLARTGERMSRAATSEERFDILHAAAHARPAPEADAAAPRDRAAPVALTAADGTAVARLRRSGTELVLGFSVRDAPGFADWIAARAPDLVRELHARWQDDAARASDD